MKTESNGMVTCLGNIENVKPKVPKEGDSNKKQVQVYSHQRILRYHRRKGLDCSYYKSTGKQNPSATPM